MKNRLMKVKPYVFGFLFAVVIFGAFWIYKHFNAFIVAANYPEVVSNLKIQKEFSVKK
jgi:hypothetical protein